MYQVWRCQHLLLPFCVGKELQCAMPQVCHVTICSLKDAALLLHIPDCTIGLLWQRDVVCQQAAHSLKFLVVKAARRHQLVQR